MIKNLSMRLAAPALAAALAVAVPVMSQAVTQAGVVRQFVHGRLAAVDELSASRGKFRLVSQARDNGDAREAIEVACGPMDVERDDEGGRPEYRLVLTSSDGGTTADFGSFVLARRGRAGFRWSTRFDTYPDGVTTITAFSGGTIEVRRDGEAVLTGEVPTFRGPGDENDEGTGARGVRRDASRLRPTEAGGRAHGGIEARYANTPRGENEQVRVQAVNLSRDGSPYAVVCIDGSSNETTLGEMSPRGRFGEARLALDTRDGDEIPGGGGVTGLSEQTVEVRDVNGTVVLTGPFPTMAR